MAQVENYKWSIIEFRPCPFVRVDENGNEVEHNCFYVRGILSTGDAILDLQNRANRNNSELHIVLFFNKIEDQKLAMELYNSGKFTHVYAKYIDVPVDPYNRTWTINSADGRFQKGDLICDQDGSPITYNTMRVSVLCDKNGEPTEDAVAKARRAFRTGLADGSMIAANDNQPVMDVDDALRQAGLTPTSEDVDQTTQPAQPQAQQHQQQQQTTQRPMQPQQRR